jgi:hypothetical protein
MTTYVPFDREQPFLLPPDLKDWLPEDDLLTSLWRRWSGCGWGRSIPMRGPAASRNITRG